MNVRIRPVQCCAVPSAPVAISDHERDRWLSAFRALSDPTRFDIFLLVAGQESPLCACDVGSRYELSQPTISHHMKILSEAGLIDVSRQGVWAYYELSDQGRHVLDGMVRSPEVELVGSDR
jgi:ArsR family transcriptional regulator, arsenate/arsenite/antimonite-responsive transcriptional repressor